MCDRGISPERHIFINESLTERNTGLFNESVKTKVIFDFKEAGTGTKHVAIATSKCVLSDKFLRVQHPSQVSLL